MSWAELFDWTGRILGGLAALFGLALFVTLLGKLGKVSAWVGRMFWALATWLSQLVQSPRQTLLEGVERSTLLAFAVFPFVWLYQQLWLRPRLKWLAGRRAPGSQDQGEMNDLSTYDPPPWNEASSLAVPAQAAASVPGPLAEMARLWEAGFDIQPLFDLPSSETFILSYYLYPQLWEEESPSILVEPATPTRDRPRWRLAMRSGKDVLCVEIDEAEVLVWWRQALFNDQGEMGLAGWAGFYELIRDYCAQNPHDYPRWQYSRDQASTPWRQALIERLAAYHEAVLYATSWGDSVNHIAFWLEELAALHRPLPRPERDWATNELRAQTDWAANFDHWLKHTQPIRLIDLLQTDHGVSALLDRLHEKSMSYGYKAVLDCLPKGVWALHGDRPVCLPLQPVLPEGDGSESRRVHFPNEWGCDGPIFQGDALIVSNTEGLRGLVDRDGRFILPCRHAYLVNAPGEGGCFEVAETLTQDRRGELLCDLIDGVGRRINPRGIKVLAGTCQQTGCVVTIEDETRPLRLDWMDNTGTVRNGGTALSPEGLRWAAVGNLSDGLRLIRCPDSGLWGYLDESGAVVISPRFRVASWFKNGLASAGLEDGRLGMIRRDGTWCIAPDWAYIAREDDGSFVVRNARGEMDFLDSDGRLLPKPIITEAMWREIEAHFVETYREWTDECNGPTLLGTLGDYNRLLLAGEGYALGKYPKLIVHSDAIIERLKNVDLPSLDKKMDFIDWRQVSELTLGYCEAQRYPIWRFLHEQPSPEDRQRWREQLIAELVAYHEAVLYVRGGDASAWAALWPGEIVGRYGGAQGPSRNWMTHELKPEQTDWTANLSAWVQASVPVRLLDLLQTEAGADALVNRMTRKSMPPYCREELAQVAPARWVWAKDSSDPVCLLLESVPDGRGGETEKVRFPKAWTESPEWLKTGPFLFLLDRYIVTNENGLSGLIDLDGRFAVPCRYAYLDEGLGNGECFEAATKLESDSRGEIVCDLIDGDGRRINLPGLKVLAGTLRRDGCVVTTEDKSQSLRLDWMDTAGTVPNGEALLSPDELRWAAVGEMRQNRRLVRRPDNGLWGYLDQTGAVVIAPTFRDASWFSDGLAKASVEPGKVGLIGQDGAWRIPPIWADIRPESRQCYVVENDCGEFGAINPAGKVIVPFRTRAELAKDEDQPVHPPRQEADDPIEQVMRQWLKGLRKHVDAAKKLDSLASLEGIFDANARTRDLMQAGVWFMPVRVLRDKPDGLATSKAGETGHIFTEYPVSLSIFDLSVEAPVAGLASSSQAIVGVPWRDLAPA